MYRLLVPVAVIIVLSCGGSVDSPVITVGDRELYAEDVVDSFEDIRGDTALVDRMVSSIVNRELILLDATRRGLFDDPEIVRMLYEREREILVNAFYEEMLGRIEVSEDTVRAFYDLMGNAVWYTILINEDSLTTDSLWNLAQSGYDFAELVRDNTIDPHYPDTEGRYIRWDMMTIPDLDREIVNGLEVGEVSQPCVVPSGWMIIRLDSTAVVDIRPFDEMEEWIEEYLWAHLREDYKVVMEDSLREARNLDVMPGTAKTIASHATDVFGHHTEYTEEEASAIAYTWEGGERSMIWLADNIANMPTFLPRDATDEAWVATYCRTLGLYDIMRTCAIEAGLDTVPETAHYIARSSNRHILDKYYPDIVTPRIEVTDEHMQRIYEEKIDLFMMPEARVFITVSAIDMAQVELLLEIVETGGDPFERLSDLTSSGSLLAPGESLLTIPLTLLDIPGQFQDQLFGAEMGEIVVCSTSVDTRIAFSLVEDLPERPKSYEDAEPQLYNMAFMELEEEVVSGLVDSLKAEYAPVIDWDYFREFYIGPVEPTEPIEPTEPVDSIEPTEPVEPVEEVETGQ